MRLTTKGRFAVTAMMDLALQAHATPAAPVALASISERQGISLSYLEQLFGKLRRHGLVRSVRGPGGGYYLGRPLADLRVADIIRAVDDCLDATLCGGNGNCRDDGNCMTHELWQALNRRIYDYLESVSLGDLIAQHRQGQEHPGSFPLAA
ncbi:MAG: Fe-S cluster assembly transcription factor [Zoogloeaceae bacterium]|jgi:Rrf2 family iron-sulfur cluster assembly transcriptional regulator|nr:Fe-S cluster assembly transcription factor [Zoogloeaceae bacterium]